MKDIARDFLFKLADEDRSFSEKLKADVVGIGYLTAIREFDYYYYNLKRHELTDEIELHFHLLQLGIPRFISRVLSGVPNFKYPVITFKSDQALIKKVLEVVTAFGFIEHGQRLGHAAMADECIICQVSDWEYDIVMPDVNFNFEQHEASVEYHYIRIQQERIDSALKEEFVKSGVTKRIETLLTNHVYVFRDNFIGYDAHPDLDDFFFGIANLETQHQSGYDSFGGHLEFGGVTFQKYMLATIYFLSLALKHEKYAAALLKKAEHIRLRDILTITCDKREFRAYMIEALNLYGPSFEGYTPVTVKEADIVIRVLSVRRDNLKILDSTMAPLPYLIEFSDTAWVPLCAGIQLSGVDFLLNSLKYNFPADYSRHQQTREKSMQRALIRTLNEYIPGLTYVDNFKIRQDGTVLTDIDFTVVEECTGTLMFFQLKFQDHYGADVRKRSSRAKRLYEGSASWLTTVRKWLNLSSPNEIRTAMRLKARFSVRNYRIVVLTRHFAHFLSQLDLQDDAAYATWPQFIDALNRLRMEKDHTLSLASLYDILKSHMTHVTAKGYKLDVIDSYHLDKLSYHIRSQAANSSQ